MPYDSTHPDYDKYSQFWRKQRDAVDGQEAIHKAGVKYLPRLDGQTNDQYDAYKDRALYLNAPGQTVTSLTGLVFRKPPTVELPAAAESWKEDITASGVSVEAAARLSFIELLTTGVIGWLVDLPARATTGKTVAQVRAEGYRPFAKFYPAESIINFKTTVIKGKSVLSLLVLTEQVLDAKDEFDTGTFKTQYRVYDLDDTGCRYRLYEKGNDVPLNGDGEYIKVNGVVLDYIPFVMVNSEGEENTFIVPPLNDLVDITLSHYTLTADYRHGLHYTALPTPVITGYDDDDGKKPLTIGPSKAIVSDNTELNAFYLEFNGQGLGGIAEELKSLRDSMAIFGARLLREGTKGVEAAETAQINRAGETSNVAAWAGVVASAITRVLEMMTSWSNITGDVSVELNKDYTPIAMSAQDLTALVNAWSSGAISMSDLFYNLQRGELVPEWKTADKHAGEIATEGPVMLPGGE